MTTGRGGSGAQGDDLPPRAGAETLAFGSGEQEVTAVAPRVGGDRGEASGGEREAVDAWYTEPGDEPASDQPSWLSSRWEQWRALDRERRLVVVLAVVAGLALVVAVAALATDDGAPPVELPAVESHGLDEDQAACFDFARTQSRLDALVSDLDISESDDFLGPLSDEVEALDTLPSRYPEADYRLVAAFSAVADASATLVETDEVFTVGGSIELRQTAVEDAVELCREVAGFDVEELEPTG
jgi:hypothetical protein